MNRRSFLQGLGSLPAIVVVPKIMSKVALAPEPALEVPLISTQNTDVTRNTWPGINKWYGDRYNAL